MTNQHNPFPEEARLLANAAGVDEDIVVPVLWAAYERGWRCPGVKAVIPWPRPGSQQERITALADGTLTATEVADKIGCAVSSVYNTINKAKDCGISASLKRGAWAIESRNESIRNAILACETLEDIGLRHGLTKERVRQIGMAAGIQSRATDPVQKARRIVERDERRRKERARIKAKRKEAERRAATGLELVRQGFSISRASRECGINPTTLGLIAAEAGIETRFNSRWKGNKLAHRINGKG